MSKSDIGGKPQAMDKKGRAAKHRHHVVTIAPSAHVKSVSELPPGNARSISPQLQRDNWRSRTSDPKTKDVADMRNHLNGDGHGNVVITIKQHQGGSAASGNTSSMNDSAEQQMQLHGSSLNKLKAHRQLRDANASADQHILGDILVHASSWNQLTTRHNVHCQHRQKDRKIRGVGWKSVYCTLDSQKLQMYDTQYELAIENAASNIAADNNNNSNHNQASSMSDVNHVNNSSFGPAHAQLTVYVSEILSVNKSIRAIDGEKCVLELNVCGDKCLLSFAETEQQTYWHSVLQDQHFSYFIWRSIPMDAQQRRSQSVLHAVYKALNTHHSPAATASYRDLDALTQEYDAYTNNALYIEEILQKISSLNIGRIMELVPLECKFMSGRLVRVIASIRTFFISALKSVSGADIPLPSTQCLQHYLDDVARIDWQHTNVAVLDFYCDRCYRLLFTLSFALTANARDEILKSDAFRKQQKHPTRRRQNTRWKPDHDNTENNETENTETDNTENGTIATAHETSDNMETERKLAEMKFEYESLQRSWRMHRDRLQEYVMAYRDAVAKLKASFHQRDNLCKKIEVLLTDKKQLTDSMQLQRKNHESMMQQAQELAAKFSLVSQQMNHAMQLKHHNMSNSNNAPNNNSNSLNGMTFSRQNSALNGMGASPTSTGANPGTMALQYNPTQFTPPNFGHNGPGHVMHGHNHAHGHTPPTTTHNPFGYIRQTSQPPFFTQPGSVSNDGGTFTPYNQMQQLSQEMSNLFNMNVPRQTSGGNTQFAWM